MSARRDALRSYLLEVTRDLISRGVIRKASGQSIADVLHHEFKTVLADAAEDWKAIGGEMIGGLISGALSGLFGSKR